MSRVDMIFFLTVVLSLKAVSSQLLAGDLEEGDACRSLGGGLGTCSLITQCKTLGDFKKNQPPICFFKGVEPIVCCPKKIESGQKVAQACADLEIRCRKNLEFEANIVGGKESAPMKHPYMVLIGFGETEKSWRCGGSLITARFVLSAAHCSIINNVEPAKWARLGELDINSTSEDAKPVDKTIIERILHPNYKASMNYYDIALFKLDSDVQFNRYITPICLNTLRDIETNLTTVVGWGMTAFAEAPSLKLLEANIEIYSDTDCKRLVFSNYSPRTSRGHDADQMLCAGVPDGSKDACQGDSGGPLYVLNAGKCAKTQVGITSYGSQCGLPNSPGVYTRVSNYISWIEEVAFGEGIVL